MTEPYIRGDHIGIMRNVSHQPDLYSSFDPIDQNHNNNPIKYELIKSSYYI